MPATALIIDDEPDIRELIAMTLTRMGLDHHGAANLDEARSLLSTYEFDVCLTDMRLPDGNGVEFVRYIQSKHPDLPVAVITAHGNMEAAVEAMKNGAFDFVSKPVDIQQLRTLVVQAVAINSADARKSASNDGHYNAQKQTQDSPTLDNNSAGDTSSGKAHETGNELSSRASSDAIANDQQEHGSASLNLHDLSKRSTAVQDDPNNTDLISANGHKLIGDSQPMQELRRMIAKVARSNAPVWVTGESGTGKELIARLIHENSPRREKPFVAINCGAIPNELMESEFFGHLKGSFTGANTDKQGLFQLADGGTLFLDEVAELPLHMQVKLLRAIQERSIRPVGGNNETPVDARILSASHKDLATEVEQARFRHDLYYRLNVISLNAPSLRERREDIPMLCNNIMEKLLKEPHADNSNSVALTQDAYEVLTNYTFPGNVRELENLLERALALVEGAVITADDIQLPLQADGKGSSNPFFSNPLSSKSIQGLTAKQTITSDNEASRITDALNATRWNRKEAAKALGLTYRQLRYRIQQLGIDKNDP